MTCGVSLDPLDKKKLDPQALGGMPGLWKATSVTDSIGGVQRTCADGQLQIEQVAIPNTQDATITFKAREFSCMNGAYKSQWAEQILQQKGTQLLLNGSPVGEIQSNFLQFQLNFGGGLFWKFSIQQVGDVMRYQESMTGRSTITAVVTK